MRENRNSSIELLKIIGIILIIISHVVQTLNNPNTNILHLDYCLNLNCATNNIQYLILSMLLYSGTLGNIIFFVCSAWFLLDSRKKDKRKIFQMIIDIWVISIIILITVYILRNGNIEIKMIIKQLFPTIFANNWYLTCYLLFYSIHPFLNIIINKIEKRTLLKTTLAMILLYVVINYVKVGSFFTSRLIIWVVIYFMIAYMKFYLVDISNNIKVNMLICILGFIGNYGIIILTNILGLHINIFSDKLIYWNSDSSPFILLMVIGMFNIARNIRIESKFINYISRLSLFIYIIHENMLLRTYYRPMMWKFVYNNMGYNHILFWVIVITSIVLAFALVSSIIYKHIIQPIVTRVGDKLYAILSNIYARIEKILLRLH